MYCTWPPSDRVSQRPDQILVFLNNNKLQCSNDCNLVRICILGSTSKQMSSAVLHHSYRKEEAGDYGVCLPMKSQSAERLGGTGLFVPFPSHLLLRALQLTTRDLLGHRGCSREAPLSTGSKEHLEYVSNHSTELLSH